MIQRSLAALSKLLVAGLICWSPSYGASSEKSYYAADLLASPPYWSSPKLQQQITKRRKILVSTAQLGQPVRWEIKGVGLVNAPIDFTWAYVRKFENLNKAPRHFTKISYRAEDEQLIVRLMLLGKEREIVAQLQHHELSADEKHLHWKNIRGLYKGLEGVLVLKKRADGKTDVSQLAFYPGDELRVPGWLFTLVSEGLMKHIASALRNDLEQGFSATKRSASGS